MHILSRARTRAGLTGLSATLALLSLAPVLPTAVAAAQTPPSLSILDASASEADVVVFTVEVPLPHPALTVDYQTRDGTALAGADYTSASGTLTIPANQASGEIRVTTLRERIYEPDETFFVDLSNSIANLADAEGQGTILNDDPVPVVSISDASVTEIDDSLGTVPAVFNVTLSNPASQAVSVRYRTQDGTATGSEPFTFALDFRDKNGTLEFPAGTNATQQISVDVKGDLLHEGNETFLVNLSNVVNARFGDRQGTGTIVDEDPVPTLSIEASKVAAEGDGGPRVSSLTASLSNPTIFDVTFGVSTSNGTAVAPSDYTDVVNGSLTIAAGQMSASVLVTVNGDPVFEPDQNLFVVIDNPSNAVLGNAVGELVLTNDDTPIIVGGPLAR